MGKTGGGEWQATRIVTWVRQGRGMVGDSCSHVGKRRRGVAGDSSSHVGKTGGGEWQATRLVMWVRQGEGSGRRVV